jgi:hypothetical protein
MEPAPRNNDQWNWMRRNGGSFSGILEKSSAERERQQGVDATGSTAKLEGETADPSTALRSGRDDKG